MRLDKGRMTKTAIVALLAGVMTLAGCGGGGGGNSSGSGVLLSTSFNTLPVGPGFPLVSVFRDQVLEFRFDANIDDGIMGGFLEDAGGNPITFFGLAPNQTGQVPYYAYVEQSAARSSIQIVENQAGALQLTSYIVGRHRDKKDTLVVVPRVSQTNSFGLPGNSGLVSDLPYTFRITETNQIFVNGTRARPIGPTLAQIPVSSPFYGNSAQNPNQVNLTFLAGNSFSPDPNPPEISSISASAVNSNGTIPPTADIIVRFTKLIDPNSVDAVRNLLIRNLTLSGGPVIVPTDPTFTEIDGQGVVRFHATPSFGPDGYTIEVRVGSFNDPAIPPILGQATGSPPVQLELSGSQTAVFQTAVCPSCLGSTSVIEDFDDTTFKDASYSAPMNDALWNDPTAPESLSGIAISGDPLSGFPAEPATDLGTRIQFEILPQPLAAAPSGLYSPFDDNGANNLGASVNPNGGSHTQHIIEGVDLGNTTDSIELMEWGPVQDLAIAPGTSANVYPQFRMWMGQTNVASPIGGGTQNGISTVYGANYAIPSLQEADPSIYSGAGGVLVTAQTSYTIGISTFRHFYPFRDQITQGLHFDFQGANANTHLLVEHNIEPGNQIANFNRFRTGALFPVRRIIGAPLSAQGTTPVAFYGGWDVYNMRFTFVKARCSAQSQWYDTGVTSPDYTTISINPSPDVQPTGTWSKWEFRAANAIVPIPINSSGWQTWYEGYAGSGTFNTSLIDGTNTGGQPTFDTRQFIQFRVTMRANTTPGNNTHQSYSSVLFGITF